MNSTNIVDQFFTGLVKTLQTRTCVECGRVFHMDIPKDAADYYAGHDCEES